MYGHTRWIFLALVICIAVIGLAFLSACGSSTGTSSGGTTAASSSETTSGGAASTGGAPTSPGASAAPGAPPAGSSGATAPTYADLAYASESAAQKLDIYLPSGKTGPFPVIVSIHGGAFTMGDKQSQELTPMLAGLDRGYAVVSINYRLATEAKFPAQVFDIKAAVRWIRANAGKYNLNPDKIVAWGDSAGAYLASILGTSAGVADLEDPSQGNADQSSAVQAVVDWYGPISFLNMDSQVKASGLGQANHGSAGSPESTLLGNALTAVPDLVKKADPTTYITADDPPFLIEHGTKDQRVPTQQSVDFAAALTKVLGASKVTLKLVEGADHLDPAFDTSENVAFVLDWIDSRLK